MTSPHFAASAGLVCTGLLAASSVCAGVELLAGGAVDAPFARLAQVDVVWTEPKAAP